MVREYIRKCDGCGKTIKNMYDYGVTTLYKQIRIGRGGEFHDYVEGQIRNKMNVTEPTDYDLYGNGWREDKDKEFSFCSPKCLLNFLEKCYDDTYSSNLEKVKHKGKEILDEFNKSYNDTKDWFKRIGQVFQKKHWIDSTLEQFDELEKETESQRKNFLKAHGRDEGSEQPKKIKVKR